MENTPELVTDLEPRDDVVGWTVSVALKVRDMSIVTVAVTETDTLVLTETAGDDDTINDGDTDAEGEELSDALCTDGDALGLWVVLIDTLPVPLKNVEDVAEALAYDVTLVETVRVSKTDAVKMLLGDVVPVIKNVLNAVGVLEPDAELVRVKRAVPDDVEEKDTVFDAELEPVSNIVIVSDALRLPNEDMDPVLVDDFVDVEEGVFIDVWDADGVIVPTDDPDIVGVSVTKDVDVAEGE